MGSAPQGSEAAGGMGKATPGWGLQGLHGLHTGMLSRWGTLGLYPCKTNPKFQRKSPSGRGFLFPDEKSVAAGWGSRCMRGLWRRGHMERGPCWPAGWGHAGRRGDMAQAWVQGSIRLQHRLGPPVRAGVQDVHSWGAHGWLQPGCCVSAGRLLALP